MNREKRSRSTYQKMAEWLVYSKEIEGQENRVNMLVKELYGHKPNLPALKDEIRKAGLV
jgi:pantothenate kinase